MPERADELRTEWSEGTDNTAVREGAVMVVVEMRIRSSSWEIVQQASEDGLGGYLATTTQY